MTWVMRFSRTKLAAVSAMVLPLMVKTSALRLRANCMLAARFFFSSSERSSSVSTGRTTCRNCCANRNARNALQGRRDAFDVLHVHGGEDIDVGCQDVEHIFVALAMPATFDVSVGQLVDEDDLRLSRKDAIEIHLLKQDALVVDFLSRYRLELFGQLCRGRAAVCLD